MFFKHCFSYPFILLLVLFFSYDSVAAESFSIIKPEAMVFHQPAPERPGNRNNNRQQYQPVKVGNHNYYYRDGLFFRLHLGRYVTIDPPLGARVNTLPRTAIHLDIGPRRYFRVGLNWYLFHGENNYEVVKDPRAKDNIADSDTSEYEQQKVDLAVYPAEDQSEEQLDRDRYECHLWANQQSGFDPTLANQDLDQRDFYIRAITACLEGRGYSVH